MKLLLPTIQKVFLYLLLVNIGLYAGMVFFHEMCPVETKLSAIEYVKYWKIADGEFMNPRMSILGPALMGLFITTVLLHIKKWKTIFFLLLGLSFLFFVAEVVYINTQQMPINEFIRNVDLSSLAEGDIAKIEQLQAKSVSNFHVRFVFSMLSFVLLSITPFLFHKLDRKRSHN